MKLSPSTIELSIIVDKLGDVQLTASQLKQMTNGRFTSDQCKIALRRVNKFHWSGRHQSLYPEAYEYVKNSPTELKTAQIKEMFGLSSQTALYILKRFKRHDRAVLNLPIAKDKKDKVLKLADGKPTTARGLASLAAEAGIKISATTCRGILIKANLLHGGKWKINSYPHVYKFVRSNPPITACDLAKKFDISRRIADNILRRCKNLAYKKNLWEQAEELSEPITVTEFMKMTGCIKNTAYVALSHAGKLKKKTFEPKPKPKSKPKPPPPKSKAKAKPALKPEPVIEPPPPPPKKQQNTHPIAILFEAWKAKNEPHTIQRFTR